MAKTFDGDIKFRVSEYDSLLHLLINFSNIRKNRIIEVANYRIIEKIEIKSPVIAFTIRGLI
jgi:hypothetical protein